MSRTEYNRRYYENGGKQKILESNKRRRSEVREFLIEAKNVPCADCGKEYPSYVMQFDHREPGLKSFNLANAAKNTTSLEKVRAEIAKCDVVCANCHAERTHGPNASLLNR